MHGPVYASRLAELVRRITPHLRENDRVLDVGCGFGALGRAIMDSPPCPKDVDVRGLERVKRGGEAIQVDAYDGVTIPHPDRCFDVVILADVLHHEDDPHRLIAECARISRRLLIIKDHKVEGPLAQQRISLHRLGGQRAVRGAVPVPLQHAGRVGRVEAAARAGAEAE